MPTEPALVGVGLALRALLAGVLAYAGASKLLEPAIFVEQVANYQWFPEGAVWVATLLPTTELVAAAGLWLPSRAWRRAAAVLALGMFLVFSVAVTRAYLLGIDVDCGCFGAGSGEIGPLTILRNLALTAGAGAVVWLSREPDEPGENTAIPA